MMSIYKECDIRGIYGKELKQSHAYEIGRAIGTILQGKRIVVCGDVRVSTPVLKASLIKGLLQSGADIVDIGMMPTPVFYFAAQFLKADGGVTVTASHNPPQYNGFKIILGEMPITPEDIERIKEMVDNKRYSEGQGKTQTADVLEEYIAYVKKRIGKSNLKVVVDAGNGCTSLLAPRMFREFGCRVEELFCEYDGTFPNRDPNPAVYSHLKALQGRVKKTGADLGVAFDGDGDRVVFVDDMGRVVTSEESLCVFADEYLKNRPSSVVFDLKSSSILKRQIQKNGGRPIMEKSGHAFIKRTFLNNNAVLAGEISGHFFFGEIGRDDGIYAALKMSEILTKKSERFSEILSRIPKTLITPDIRIHWKYSERDALLKKVKGLGNDGEISLLDGVRIEFPFGWILVRKSVTEEGITIRIEADDLEKQKVIVDKLLKAIPELKGKHEMF